MIRSLNLIVFISAIAVCLTQSIPQDSLTLLEKRVVGSLEVHQSLIDKLLITRDQRPLSIDFLIYPPAGFSVEQEQEFISRIENLLAAKVFALKSLSYVRNQLASLEPVDLTLDLRFHFRSDEGGGCLGASVNSGGGQPVVVSLSEVCLNKDRNSSARMAENKATESSHRLEPQSTKPDAYWPWLWVVFLGGVALFTLTYLGRNKSPSQKIAPPNPDPPRDQIADDIERDVEVFKALRCLDQHRTKDHPTKTTDPVYVKTLSPALSILNANIKAMAKSEDSCLWVQVRNDQFKSLGANCRELASLLQTMGQSKAGISRANKQAFLMQAPSSLHLNLGYFLRQILDEPEMQELELGPVKQAIPSDVFIKIRAASIHGSVFKTYLDDLGEIFREWLGNAINNARTANGFSVKMSLVLSGDGGPISLRFQNQGVACPEVVIEMINGGDADALAKRKGRFTGYPTVIDSIRKLWDIEGMVFGDLKCRIFLQNLEDGVESRLVWSHAPKKGKVGALTQVEPQVKDLLIVEDQFEEKFKTLKDGLAGLSFVHVKSQQEALALLLETQFKRVILDANYLLSPTDKFAQSEIEDLGKITENSQDASVFLFTSDLDTQAQWKTWCEDKGVEVKMSGNPEDLGRWLEDTRV
jgi:hypothetical protein